MLRRKFRSPLPGFGSTFAVTLIWLMGLLVLPLIACLAKAATLGPGTVNRLKASARNCSRTPLMGKVRESETSMVSVPGA